MPAFPPKTNYAAGDVLTAAQMNDVGNALAAYQFTVGKNKIINGDFRIWQRGTSFSVTGTGSALYGAADRWAYFMNGSGGTNTVSQQTFTPGSAPVAGYEGQFFHRWTTTTVGSGQSVADVRQAIEDVRTFAGQTVTLSYWAKSSSNVTVSPIATQNFGSGGSASVDTSFATASLTTSWVRYTATISVPSISGKTVGTSSFLSINLRSTGFSNGTTIDIWGVQLEAGSTATPLTTASGTIQGELALCRRYLPAIISNSGFGATFVGYAYATNAGIYPIPFDVPARVAPTGISIPTVAGNFVVTNKTNGDAAITALTFDVAGPNGATVLATATLTQGDVTRLRVAGTSGYILFTGCEL